MAVRVTYSSPWNDGNMSRVRIAQEIEVLCLNTTTSSTPACDRSAQGISLSTPILMMTFGVLGNVLALIVLYSSRREAHARRTVFFVMLAGLAWTDLIGQFAVSPIAIITYANNLQWIGGAELCRYHGFMMVSFGLVMPLIVCCMSVERLLAIKFSYYYAKHVTRRKAQFTFMASWCVTAMFTALPFAGFGSYELQYPGSWCFLNFHRESKLDTIYAAMFSSFNIVAILITILCNLIVAGTLFRMRRSRQLHSSPSVDRRMSGSAAASTTSGTFIRSRRHSDMEAQMIWFLCLITVAFSVCWLPLNVHILLMQFTGATNQVLDLKFIRMASCNQILDPWLYVIFRKNSLMRIIGRIKACLSVVEHVPHNGQIKKPNMRYVISNKSYTYEATSLGKTIMGGHCCLKSPTKCRYSAHEGCEDVPKNDCSDCSSDSAAQLMSVCSYCDRHCKSHSASNPLVDTSPGLSPYCSDAECFNCDVSQSVSKFGTGQYSSRYKKCGNTCLGQSAHVISEPLLDITIKPNKSHKSFFKTLDVSVSSDSNGGYYSMDSKHQPPVNSANHSKSKKNMQTADTKLKSPFLGSSLNTTDSQTQNPYSSQSQSLIYLNNSNSLFLAAHSSLTLPSRLEDENVIPDSRRTTQCASPSNIPVLENIPEFSTIKRHGNLTANTGSQQPASSDTSFSNLLCPTNDESVYKSKIVPDSQFVYSDSDTLVSNPAVTRGSDNRFTQSMHCKTRSCTGAVIDISDEDFHLKRLFYPLKMKSSTFSSKLFSTGKINKMNKNVCSVSGTKIGSSNSLLQTVDHSDHLKCFKSKKTPAFLGKNGQMAYLEGIKSQGNVCEHGFLELSVGSCP